MLEGTDVVMVLTKWLMVRYIILMAILLLKMLTEQPNIL